MKKSIRFFLLCAITNTVSVMMALSVFEDIGRTVERTTEGVVRDVDRSVHRTFHETDKTTKHEFEPFSPTRPAEPSEQTAAGIAQAQDSTSLEGSLEGDDRTRDYTLWKLTEEDQAGVGSTQN